MFDIERMIADCVAAVAAEPSHKGVHGVLARILSDPACVLRGLGAPARAGITPLYRSDDLTILKTEAAQSAYAPEKLSMEKTVGAFSPEDRIGALELQNLSVADNRALLLHYAQALSLPTGSDALKGLLEE